MKTATVFLFMISLLKSYSQVNEVWRVDNTISDPTVIVTDILNLNHNLFLTIQNFDPLNTAYVQKLDGQGNQIAFDTIPRSYSICDKRMARDEGANIYVCGAKDSTLSRTRISLVKYDSLLVRQWTVDSPVNDSADYYSPRICFSTIEDRVYVVCSKFISTGAFTVVLKYDPAGNLIWESDSMPTLGLNCIRFVIDNDGKIVLGGFVYYPGTDEDFTLIKLDTNGTIEWNVSTHDVLDDRVEDLAIDSDNNIYSFGYFSDAVSSRIVKYGPSGNHIWTSNIPNFYGSQIAITPTAVYASGNDSASNNLMLVRFDTSGLNMISSTLTHTSSGIINTSFSNSSHLYVCYNTDTAGSYRWSVLKTDTNLNLKWDFNYPDTFPVFAYPTSFLSMNDGFVVSGKIDPFVSTVKFSETSTVSINELKGAEIIYWPNPATEKLNIANIPGNNNNITVRIFDATARCIFNRRYAADNRLTIDLPEFKAGLYYFEISTGSNRYFEKMIISR